MRGTLRRVRSGEGVFSRAAATYNAVGPRHFTYFAGRIVEYAEIGSGDRVLDLATGTGEVLCAAAERCGDGGGVVGVDIAAAMLERATAAVSERRLGNAELRLMDAERLTFPDGTFDVVLCAFALSSMLGRGWVLDGAHRVLRAGGRLGIVDTFGWYFQHDPRWQWQEEVLRSFGALRDGAPADDAFTALTAAVSRAGFAAVEPVEESFELVFGDEEEWWRWSWSHGTRGLLEAIPAARREEAKQRLFLGLQGCRESDGKIHGTIRATLLRAGKPG